MSQAHNHAEGGYYARCPACAENEQAEAEAKRDYHLDDLVRSGFTPEQAEALISAIEAYS